MSEEGNGIEGFVPRKVTGKNLVRNTIIDPNTGEILKEKAFVHYDGFNDKGYKYRYRTHGSIVVYPDTIPVTLSEKAFRLLYMLAEIANEDNVLVYRVKIKSRFSDIIYKPLDKDQVRERLRWKIGENAFDKYWKELKKHCIKRVQYHEYLAWALNPAIINKCPQIPPWLYAEFSEYLNPYMTKLSIKKMQNMLAVLDEGGDNYIL